MGDRIKRDYRFSTVPEHLIRDKRLSDRSFRLWCILDRYAGANGQAFPLRSTLAEDLGCSRASLDRALAELVETGWLSKERREAGGSNDYTLHVIAPPKGGPRGSKSQVKEEGRLTDEDTPLDSLVSAPPRLASEDTLDSQMTTPVLTGDAHKEASPNETQGSETSADSLRSSPAPDSTQQPEGDTSPTVPEQAEKIAKDWWDYYQAHYGPIMRNGRANPFIALRDNLIVAALNAGFTETEIKRALMGTVGTTPDAVPAKPLFQRRCAEARQGQVPGGQPNTGRHNGGDAERERLVNALNG